MTLKEGLVIFQEAKHKLLNTKFSDNHLIETLKNSFITLDHFIEQNNAKTDIINMQNEILDLLTKSDVYGLEQLFDK